MKWFGEIGFNEVVEEERGVYVPTVVPHEYFGDELDEGWRYSQPDKINTDLSVSNKLSVVADMYLQNNFRKIAYVTYGGAKWTVSNAARQFPRLIITLGSLYLEET